MLLTCYFFVWLFHGKACCSLQIDPHREPGFRQGSWPFDGNKNFQQLEACATIGCVIKGTTMPHQINLDRGVQIWDAPRAGWFIFLGGDPIKKDAEKRMPKDVSRMKTSHGFPIFSKYGYPNIIHVRKDFPL